MQTVMNCFISSVKKLQAKSADANSHQFITKADQELISRPNGIAMSLCKPEEADSCVSSTWNMRLIRVTIKSTSEQWTRVIILESPICIIWVMLRYGDMLRNFNPCDIWFLNSLERHAARPCHSSMPTQGVICLHQCLALSKKWMKCVECFSCYKHFCRSDLKPNQPYHQFPEYGMSGTPDYADVGPKLWFNLCQWSQKTAFHPWPKVFGLNTTNTTYFVPTCKHVRWWSQLSHAKLPTVCGWEWHDRTKT